MRCQIDNGRLAYMSLKNPVLHTSFNYLFQMVLLVSFNMPQNIANFGSDHYIFPRFAVLH